MNNITTYEPVISVVVPVYNEIGVIKRFHSELIATLEAYNKPYEIIYIDDHSTDGTFDWLISEDNSSQKFQPIVQDEDNRSPGRLRSSSYRRNAFIKSSGDVRVLTKQGKKGKAYSLIEGFEKARGLFFVMIDGDLQYPPRAIPEMIEALSHSDIVIANRKNYKDSVLRKLLSSSFRYGFGQMLFGLPTDIQSGLKAFSREVFETVKFEPRSAWTFDLEFLHRARHSGFRSKNIDITFSPRDEGDSKVNIFKTTWEIGMNALYVKTRKLTPLYIPPSEEDTMKGAGVGYNGQKYITHTTLPHYFSALQTFSVRQKLYLILLPLFILGGFFIWPLTTAQILVSALSILYFIDTIFFFSLVMRSLHKPEEYRVSERELENIFDESLPIYTILCPLYREAHVVPQFVDAISKLDWPKDKLDVMLLLEEDDRETIATISAMQLPSFVRIVVVPHSMPKTKPKACNYGLAFAKGEYLVIFDAEDIPDPLQLKKAYLGFQKAPEKVQCLQAKLNYYNSRQNILTRFFTAEYSLWFDLTLTGLQSLNSALPLGGTSNHFKTKVLRDLQGWDPFNVTEDADLGVRLFQKGFQTAIIDSTTLEEATSKMKNWIRQRSRWLKGYMQTYLVHTRDHKTFIKEKGLIHSFIFQLNVGGKILFILLNPIMWVITFLYFASYHNIGELIEAVYVPPISYIAVFSWIFGNFLFLYAYMLGVAKRGQWDLMKYIFIIPFYWLMMSIAGAIGFYQLLFKPHYWEKTVHGFHLLKKPSQAKIVEAIEAQPIPVVRPAFVPAYAETAASLPRKQGVNWKMPSMPKIVFQVPRIKWNTDIVMWQAVLFVSLLAVDVILANFLLPQSEIQTYWLLSLVGKTGFIVAQIVAFFAISLLSKNKKPENKLFIALFFTFFFHWISFVGLGLEGSLIVPLLGEQFLPIIPYLPFYTLGLMSFALATVFASFYLKNKEYSYALVSLVIIASQAIFIFPQSEDIVSYIKILAYLGTVDLLAMIALQANPSVITLLNKLFAKKEARFGQSNINILIFNWRDTKHVNTGGAEVYIHEIAKRWVQKGNKVTLFCGNDGKNVSDEVVDGVKIVRRGGAYTVYIMAIIYYFLKFRNTTDVIIDCENGIPFFTPLYTRKPVVLLVHHVHQEIFRVFLQFPLNHIAAFLEAKLMPLVYRNKEIVTVSQSSRDAILNLGFTGINNVDVISNGVSESLFVDHPKTENPSFVYIGRLKEYKNIDVAIKAFKRVVKDYPTAKFSIAGVGECVNPLKALVSKLNLENNVEFLGRITEDAKAKLLSESWVAIQPSQMEGWGITVIEANAAGTPVIASHVKGLKDSVVDGNTGVLVEVGNVWAFARTMTELIKDASYREKLSINARAWAQNFDWNKSSYEFFTLVDKTAQTQQQSSVYAKLNTAIKN